MHPLEAKTNTQPTTEPLESLKGGARAAFAPAFGLVSAICKNGAESIESQLPTLARSITAAQRDELAEIADALRSINRRIAKLTA